MRIELVLSIMASAFALSFAAEAQSLHHFVGTAGDWMGYSVSGVGDLDADGYDDVVAGLPGHSNFGQARVYSGAQGALLATWFYGSYFEFGVSVDSAGDVDGDGVPDVIISARDIHPDTFDSYMSVWSGRTLSMHCVEFLGSKAVIAVSGRGDVDGDGLDDVAAGQPAYSFVRLFESCDFAGDLTKPGSQFGASVDGLDDVDGDGIPELLVGAPLDGGFGSASVRSGATGAELFFVRGLTAGDRLGTSVAALGDLDGDGVTEFVAGADQSGNGKPGYVLVCSGADGDILRALVGGMANDRFGASVAGAGDFNGDGVPDIAVGASQQPQPGPGYVTLFSGADFTVLRRWSGEAAGDAFGFAVDRAGDVDGNGFSDLIVGAPYSDAGGVDAGTATIFGGCPGAIEAYGHGCPGSGGFVPELAMDGCPTAGGSISLAIEGGVGGGLTLVLVGLETASGVLASGCPLYVGGLLPLMPTLPLGGVGPGQGSVQVNATLPASMPAVELELQGFVLDPAVAAGYAATNGVRLAID